MTDNTSYPFSTVFVYADPNQTCLFGNCDKPASLVIASGGAPERVWCTTHWKVMRNMFSETNRMSLGFRGLSCMHVFISVDLVRDMHEAANCFEEPLIVWAQINQSGMGAVLRTTTDYADAAPEIHGPLRAEPLLIDEYDLSVALKRRNLDSSQQLSYDPAQEIAVEFSVTATVRLQRIAGRHSPDN
jgi:hypothetical protein